MATSRGVDDAGDTSRGVDDAGAASRGVDDTEVEGSLESEGVSTAFGLR